MIQRLFKFSMPVGGGVALLYAAMTFAILSVGVQGGSAAATNESVTLEEYESNITSIGDDLRRNLSRNISNPGAEMFVMSTAMAPMEGVLTAARAGVRFGYQTPYLADEVSWLSWAISYFFFGRFAITTWRNIRTVNHDSR